MPNLPVAPELPTHPVDPTTAMILRAMALAGSPGLAGASPQAQQQVFGDIPSQGPATWPDILRALASFAGNALPMRGGIGPGLSRTVKPAEQAEELVTLYHGTPLAFSKFDPGRASQTGLGGKGFFFDADPKLAGAFADTVGNLKEAGPKGRQVISIQVPRTKILDLSNPPPDIKALGHGGNIDAAIQAKGYAGIFSPKSGEYVIYDPEAWRTVAQ